MAFRRITTEWPSPIAWQFDTGQSNIRTLDASPTRIAFIFRAPDDGTIDTIEFGIWTVATAQDLKVSLQNVISPSAPARPDDVVDQFRVISSGSITGNTWIVPGLITSDGTDTGTKRTVTRGELVAFVIEWDSTIGDLTVQANRISWGGGTGKTVFPLLNEYTGSWGAPTGTFGPLMAVKYSDGSYPYVPDAIPMGPPSLGATRVTGFDSNATPDEIGLRFTYPVKIRISGAWARSETRTKEFDIVVYDAGDAVLHTYEWRGGGIEHGNPAFHHHTFKNLIVLEAATTYRIVLKATHPTTQTLYDFHHLPTAAQREAFNGKPFDWQQTERTDAGAWTDSSIKVPPIGLLIEAIDAQASEVVFPPADLVTGKTIGLHWLEIYHKDFAAADFTYLWAAVDLNDPSTYYGGYKEARVLQFGPFERALSDSRGRHEAASFTWRVSDHDRLIRDLLDAVNIDPRVWINRNVAMRTVDDVSRRALQRPRLVARGVIREQKLLPDLEASFVAEDALSARFREFGKVRQIPSRAIGPDFPDAPEASLRLPVPIIYGPLSDTLGTGPTVIAGPSSVTVIGLVSPQAQVTGLTVIGVAGDLLGFEVGQYYHVTAVVDGEEGLLSATVYRDNTDEVNPRNRISWVAVASATEYRIYRSQRSDFAQLEMMVVTAPTVTFDDLWTGRSERSPTGASPHDHAQFFSTWRAPVKYRVYALFADGTLSQPTEGVMTNADATISKGSEYFTGVHTHADAENLFTLSIRRCRITWTAVTDAVGYRLFFYHGRYHWGYIAKVQIDVGAAVLTTDHTFTLETPAIDLPEEAAAPDPGAAPTTHVGSETIAGKIWQVLLVCGHAVKAVHSVYFEVESETEGTDPDLESGRTFEQATNFGTDWLVPGFAGWPFGNDYVDKNGRRYTVIYAAADPPPKRVHVNLEGTETVGDGSGTTIRSIAKQAEHFCNQYLLLDYQGGLYATPPTWPADLDGPGPVQVDGASFDAVDALMKLRLPPDGYTGAGGFGLAGEILSGRDALARFAQSGGFQTGHSRNSQIIASAIDEDPSVLATAPVYDRGSNNLIFKGSIRVTFKNGDLENEVLYNYARAYPDSFWIEEEASVSDAASIAAHQETKTGKPIDLWFVRRAAVALSIASHRLKLRKEIPRTIRLQTTINALSVELGVILRLSHPDLPRQTLLPARVIRHTANMSDNTVELELLDMARLFVGSGLYCDRATVTDDYATATTAERDKCMYLANRTTGLFSNGDAPKRYR